MRYVNKIFSLLLLAVILMNAGFSSTVFYASQITDVYSEGTSEIINIEGVTYTHIYF